MRDIARHLLDRVGAAGRILISIQFALAVGVIIYVGFHVAGDVFSGSPAALPVRVEGLCQSADASPACHVSADVLTPGRYRIATDRPATGLTLVLSAESSLERARVLVLRSSASKNLQLEMRAGGAAGAPIATAPLGDLRARTLTWLPAAGPAITALSFVPRPETVAVPIVLDEFALFTDDRGLLNDVRPIFSAIPPQPFYGTLLPRAVVRLCIFVMVAGFFVPRQLLRRVNPAVLGVVCFSLCLLDLAILNSPYWSQDLRSFYVNGPLRQDPGGNLNTGLWQGFRLLHGEGLTTAAGKVPWERMPGYGLFCALAGGLFGGRTLLDMAIATVLLQVLLYAAALTFFAWAAGLLFSAPVVWTVGVLIALLPKELGYTQVDAIIAPVMLLVLGALCMRLKTLRDGRPPSLRLDVLVHLTFALWFVLRPDVLPGWLVMSLVLHWRQWRRLLIPAVLFLAIGGGWAVYKMRYTGEFVLTTSSAGASLFCGLWEVPSRFALTCSDEQYFEWIEDHTSFIPQSKRANDFAVREVLRFWLTFPGHFVVMLDHKMMQCLEAQCLSGLRTYLQESLYLHLARPPRAMVGLLTIIGLCVAAGHERRRTLFLTWPLFFNAPIFWVMFASEGRFYSGIPIVLLVAAVPPLFERQFYARLVARPWRTGSVLAGAGILAVTAWPFHDWLMRADGFHYWTPLLDPSKSALSGFK